MAPTQRTTTALAARTRHPPVRVTLRRQYRKTWRGLEVERDALRRVAQQYVNANAELDESCQGHQATAIAQAIAGYRDPSDTSLLPYVLQRLIRDTLRILKPHLL